MRERGITDDLVLRSPPVSQVGIGISHLFNEDNHSGRSLPLHPCHLQASKSVLSLSSDSRTPSEPNEPEKSSIFKYGPIGGHGLFCGQP